VIFCFFLDFSFLQGWVCIFGGMDERVSQADTDVETFRRGKSCALAASGVLREAGAAGTCATPLSDAGSPKSLRAAYRLAAERIFFLAGLLMLWNLGKMILPAKSGSALGLLFKCVAWPAYALAYCLPLFFLLLLAGGVLGLGARRGSQPGGYPIRTACFCIIALAGLFITHALIYADSWVYAIFQFHLNGYVLNLLMTPGGVASMDMSAGGAWGFAGRLLALLAAQGLILLIAFRSRWFRRGQQWLLKGLKGRLTCWAALVLLVLGQAAGYGLARASWYRPVLQLADTIPFYLPITFNHLARSLGWNPSEGDFPSADDASASLRCPVRPLAFRADSSWPNVMILMCETLRADMLTPEIMPKTFAFARRRALRFTQHYSSGNSTREGVFGAMTGLHGTYWRPMLRDNRGSAVVKLLQDNGYELELFTSQSFTYPEFDRTVFATVPAARMHVRSEGAPPWQRDRDNVADILRWLDARDRSTPFMTFMFFESSHARYAFPPESVIRPDYCKSFDYATDLIDPSPHQVRQVFNRYVNAVHHLDSQLGRLLEYLETSGQLDHTIVVLTGDHGDAFYEKGRWGHGGHSFLAEQIHVPLVLHLPGVPPEVRTDLSSHVDIFPTILANMGLENPPSDYSVGRDLLAPAPRRAFAVCSGWDSLAVIAEQGKYVFPYRGFRLPETFSRDDRSENEKELRQQLQPQLVDLMKQMRRFLKR
jgi:membrane-anchored protein YejM (alkaline phosphatase superfamily)